MVRNLGVVDLLQQGECVAGIRSKIDLPPRGGATGGGDLALPLLGITAFLKRFIKSSVRKTGPGKKECQLLLHRR